METVPSGFDAPSRRGALGWLVVARSGDFCPRLLPAGARGDRSDRPGGGRAKIGGGAWPAADALPRVWGFFSGAEPPGLGSGRTLGLRRRQGTAGFKLKIPARRQLSCQGLRPRAGHAVPGPLDFRGP